MPAQPSQGQRRAELSQHFLRSESLAAELVAQSSISGRDLVVEIGPGHGVFTRVLARTARHVLAVELDERLARELRAELHDRPNVEIVGGDFLNVDLPAGRYKVFGNVPYARTAAIVRRLTETPDPPDDAHLIVQLEAAERFAGYPYAPESLSSLRLKPWWHVEITHRLRRRDFEPPPRVRSVLIWLARRRRPLVDRSERALYADFIAHNFGRRGRTVRQELGDVFGARQLRRLAADLGIGVSEAPSSVTFDQWLRLFRHFAWNADASARRRVRGASRRARAPRQR